MILNFLGGTFLKHRFTTQNQLLVIVANNVNRCTIIKKIQFRSKQINKAFAGV